MSKRLLLAVAGVIVISSSALAAEKKDPKKEKLIKRGEYIVLTTGCADCHTPHVMGPKGPEEVKGKELSGHPAEMAMPPAPKLPPGPWLVIGSGDFTAWAGPWGVSYPRNLTPDKETGLGDWTEQNFIDTIKTGLRMGKGRPILPPMPIPAFKNFTDDDLKAIFAYLQSIPAVKNAVPEPVPPAPPPAAPAAPAPAPAPVKK